MCTGLEPVLLASIAGGSKMASSALSKPPKQITIPQKPPIVSPTDEYDQLLRRNSMLGQGMDLGY